MEIALATCFCYREVIEEWLNGGIGEDSIGRRV